MCEKQAALEMLLPTIYCNTPFLSHIQLIIHRGPVIMSVIMQRDPLNEMLAFGILYQFRLILIMCLKILFNSKSKQEK